MSRIIIVVLLAIPFFIYAGNSPVIKLSVIESVQMAVQNNLDLKNTDLQLKGKKLAAFTSWNTFLPDVALSTGVGKSYDFDDNGDPAALSTGFSSSVSLNSSMVTGIISSVNDYHSGLITYNQAKARLETDVTKYYYNILLYQKKLELNTKKSESAKQRLEVALKKIASGSISEIDKLTAELGSKSALYDKRKTENEYKILLINFNHLIGLDKDQVVEFITPFPDIESIAISLDNVDMDKTDTVKLLYNNLKGVLILQAASAAAVLPSFSVGYSVSSSYLSDPFAGTNLSFAKNDWSTSGSLRFSVSFPLQWAIPFSDKQVGVLSSIIDTKIAQNKLEIGKRELELKFTEYKLNINSIKEDIESLMTNKDIAYRTYEMVKKLYEVGGKDYLELKEAETDLYETEINILSASYEFMGSLMEIKYLLNGAL